jgi:hypothetical protein
MLRNLWSDDSGTGLVTMEILFLFAILVLGIITGLVAVRQGMISELIETAQAIMAINQSFSFSGQANCVSVTAGSAGSDILFSSSLGTPFVSFGQSSVGATSALISQTPRD